MAIVRQCLFNTYRTHVTELYAKFFKLPVTELCKLQIATVMHKFYHHSEILPGVFHNYFTRNSELHRYSTKQQFDLHVCRVLIQLSDRGRLAIPQRHLQVQPSDQHRFTMLQTTGRNDRSTAPSGETSGKLASPDPATVSQASHPSSLQPH